MDGAAILSQITVQFLSSHSWIKLAIGNNSFCESFKNKPWDWWVGLRPKWALCSLYTALSQPASQPGWCPVGNKQSLTAGPWQAGEIAPICSHLANSPQKRGQQLGGNLSSAWAPAALLGPVDTVSSWVRILSGQKLSLGKTGKDTFSLSYTKDRCPPARVEIAIIVISTVVNIHRVAVYKTFSWSHWRPNEI